MQTSTKALIVGTIAGLLLLSLVVSMGFTYTVSRTAVAYVVTDGNANIALVPNNNNLQSQQGYFAQIQNNGELVINFGNVAPSSVETLTDVFYIVNNLNEPVSVTITVEGNTNNYGISVTPYSFTLQPGQANEVPISITLNVGGASPNTQLSFTITITANYMAAGSSGSGSGSGSGS